MNVTTPNKTAQAIVDECIAARLRLLNRAITNIYDEAFRPLGAKVSQMNILVTVAGIGIARPADICDRLHLDVSTLSRNVDRMKTRGWLEVVPDEDGRAQPIRLTASGRQLVERAIPKWNMAQESARALLGDDVVAAIDPAVQRVRDAG